MEQNIKLVGSGIATLIFNVRSCDSKGQPIKQELDETLVQELDYLQSEARHMETVVAEARRTSFSRQWASDGSGGGDPPLEPEPGPAIALPKPYT